MFPVSFAWQFPIWRHHPLKDLYSRIPLPFSFPPVVNRIAASQRWPCLNPGSLGIGTLHVKRALQMRLKTLRWTICPLLPWWAQTNHTVLKSRRERQMTGPKKCDRKRTRPGFEDGGRWLEWLSVESQQKNNNRKHRTLVLQPQKITVCWQH